MRMKLLVGLLVFALAAASMFPPMHSDAATGPQQGEALTISGSLPNYDIRLEGKGEFQEYELATPNGKQLALQSDAARGRVAEVEQFRANVGTSAQNLRAVVNETGALKKFLHRRSFTFRTTIGFRR
jgi:hypothetical protein